MLDRDEALNALDWNWGEAYEISEALSVWRAVRRDSQRTLIATAPKDLRDLIIEDYTKEPVPRDR